MLFLLTRYWAVSMYDAHEIVVQQQFSVRSHYGFAARLTATWDPSPFTTTLRMLGWWVLTFNFSFWSSIFELIIIVKKWVTFLIFYTENNLFRRSNFKLWANKTFPTKLCVSDPHVALQEVVHFLYCFLIKFCWLQNKNSLENFCPVSSKAQFK